MIFMQATSMRRGGPLDRDIFGPKRGRDFQGPPLSLARVTDLPELKSLCPSKKIGPLVILCT
jgi:hypothetical protein